MREKISERFIECRNRENISARKLARILVSEETLKGYTDDSIRQIIGKIERGTTDPNPIIIKAYCKHFNTTSDYLLGIRNVKTTNEDIAMICKYTGLSDEAIFNIESLSEMEKTIFDKMICGYGMTKLISDIKRLLAFRYYRDSIHIEVDASIKNFDTGTAVLVDNLNKMDITQMLFSIIDNDLHDIFNSLEEDKDINGIVTSYFLESIKPALSLDELKTIDEIAKEEQTKKGSDTK